MALSCATLLLLVSRGMSRCLVSGCKGVFVVWGNNYDEVIDVSPERDLGWWCVLHSQMSLLKWELYRGNAERLTIMDAAETRVDRCWCSSCPWRFSVLPPTTTDSVCVCVNVCEGLICLSIWYPGCGNCKCRGNNEQSSWVRNQFFEVLYWVPICNVTSDSYFSSLSSKLKYVENIVIERETHKQYLTFTLKNTSMVRL